MNLKFLGYQERVIIGVLIPVSSETLHSDDDPNRRYRLVVTGMSEGLVEMW